MRTAISFLVGLITAAVVVGLGVLVAQNGQGEQFTLLGATFQGAMGWVTAGAAALGFLLAFLILIPGRLASAWQRWTLGRRGQELEEQLRVLQQQHAELQGSHWSLLEEHRQVMANVLTPVAAGRVQSASVAAAGAPAATPPRTGAIIMPAAPRQPGAPDAKVQLPARQDAPLDRLRERIIALRVALAAKLAGLKRSATRDRPPDTGDKGPFPHGPTAASS